MLIDKKCIAGYVYDSTFGECMKCTDMFNCTNCDQNGCLTCDNGVALAVNGKC